MQPLSWRSPPGQNPNIISTLIHVNRAFIMIMKVITSINDHHVVPWLVPIYLCNLDTLPTVIHCHCHHPNKNIKTNKSKYANPTQKESWTIQQNECPPPHFFSIKGHSIFMFSYLSLLFSFSSPIPNSSGPRLQGLQQRQERELRGTLNCIVPPYPNFPSKSPLF